MNSIGNETDGAHDGMNSFVVEPAAVCASHKKTLMPSVTLLLTDALVSKGHTAERPTAKELILS